MSPSPMPSQLLAQLPHAPLPSSAMYQKSSLQQLIPKRCLCRCARGPRCARERFACTLPASDRSKTLCPASMLDLLGLQRHPHHLPLQPMFCAPDLVFSCLLEPSPRQAARSSSCRIEALTAGGMKWGGGSCGKERGRKLGVGEGEREGET